MRILSEKLSWTEDNTRVPPHERIRQAMGGRDEATDTDATLNVQDKVSISDEARQRQQAASEEDGRVDGLWQDPQGTENRINGSELSSVGGADGAGSTDIKEFLRKQIREVAKQLAEAQERLSMAQAQSDNSSISVEDATSEKPDGQNAQADIKRMEAEVSELTNALAVLNLELLKHEKKGAEEGSLGSAGVNLAGTGEGGGLGERMPIG